jgi:hypothetical protein
VKNKRSILSFLSVFAVIVFLAGSTGVTIIMHSCPVCEDFYVKSGVFLSPEQPEDDCCEEAKNHCSTDDSIRIEGTCCHFRIDNIKLNNYTASVHYIQVLTAEFTGLYTVPVIEVSNPLLSFPREIHNKHGGRYLITYYCQIIS